MTITCQHWLLDSKKDLVIIFTASYAPFRSSKNDQRKHVHNYVNAYNKHIRRIVENVNHDRMVFMNATHGLGLTPDGYYHLADGTHYDYPNDVPRYGARLDTNRYYFDMLMNFLCSRNSGEDPGEYCC